MFKIILNFYVKNIDRKIWEKINILAPCAFGCTIQKKNKRKRTVLILYSPELKI